MKLGDDLLGCSSLLLLAELAASCGLRRSNAPNGRDVGSFPGQHALPLPFLLKDLGTLLILFFLKPGSASSVRWLQKVQQHQHSS